MGVCVLVALDLDGGDQHPLHGALMDNCCNGSISTAGHDQASRHLAMCFVLKKEHRKALQIAEEVASRNPDWLEIQILVVQICGSMPDAEEEVAQKIANLRRAYKLTADSEERVAAVESEIARRKASRYGHANAEDGWKTDAVTR